MPSGSGEVFFFSGNAIRPLPARSFRAGLFGASLEGVPQRLIEIEPNIVSGHQLEPGSDDPPRFALLKPQMDVSDWLGRGSSGCLSLLDGQPSRNVTSSFV